MEIIYFQLEQEKEYNFYFFTLTFDLIVIENNFGNLKFV
jgi:hypothetical protein